MPWQPGMRITAERLEAMAADPVDYTPTWSCASGAAPSFGTSIIRAEYYRSGPLIHFNQQVTFAGASFGGGTWRFSLPVPMAASQYRASATCQGFHVSTVTIRGGFAYLAADSPGSEVFWLYTDGGSIWGPSAPFTWANGDFLIITGTYEAA